MAYKKYTYTPGSQQDFRISRSKIDLFLNCPRCFYLDRRLGISRPSFPAFSLNNAVDILLKKEFDIHRARQTAHPLMEAYGLKAVPFAHTKMDDWRDALRKGVEYLHPATNLMITGGVDDIWQNEQKELIVVDYKATSTVKEISLDDEYKSGYKRQMEVYQWLLRQNGFKVSDTGYFVFANGQIDRKAFDGRLEFSVQIVPYIGDDQWVEKAVLGLHQCLNLVKAPSPGEDCEYCRYVRAAQE